MSYQVVGAVFDLPEEIARELLTRELPPGNTITKISKVRSYCSLFIVRLLAVSARFIWQVFSVHQVCIISY